MKFLLLSDAHTEFYKTPEKVARALPPLPDPADYDTVLLAGDIGYGTAGVEWARDFFPQNKLVVYTTGNHEFYKQLGGLVTTNKRIERVCKATPNVVFADPGHIPITDGSSHTHIVIACNSWTDFKLKGYDEILNPPYKIARMINDFRLIYGSDSSEPFFTPEDCIALAEHHRNFLRETLKYYRDRAEWKDTKFVVMTHFVPTQLAIDEQYRSGPTSWINPYFNNDMDDIMEEFAVDLWVYGHTHSRADFVHPCGTRVVGNPLGYPGENPGFQWKICEV